MIPKVPQFRIVDAARLLGVSDDTVRRWVDAGALPARPDDPSEVQRSARNRLVGLVTSVVSDRVMSQVEMQCGPHRVVSLMSTEAVGDLGLEPGVLAVAVIKSTNVVVETPGGNS